MKKDNDMKVAVYMRVGNKDQITGGSKEMSFKELRRMSGMTQKEFQDYFGIPKRNIEDWDRGVAKCKPYLIDLMLYKLKKEGIIRGE